MSIQIRSLDHLVLTVRDIDATVDFYTRILGMEKHTFGDNRTALGFGCQKINLHPYRKEFEPKAETPLPGSEDLCFLVSTPMDQLIRHLGDVSVEILEGPVQRTGATGPILSVYLRDPDGNLIELSNPITETP